jgi:O-methyltransferase
MWGFFIFKQFGFLRINLAEINLLPDKMNITDIINITLILVFLFIAFKYAETFWSYKISKPYQWEQAVKNKELSKELKALEFQTRDKVRFYFLWFQVERLKKKEVKGCFAELGVYKGVTANMLYEMDKNRTLHLFDTFEGFNEKDLMQENVQGGKYTTKEFSDTSVEAVKAYINGGDKVIFHKGYFPETAKGLESETFALVNIDADLYQPTLEGLKFFYPRLSPGGVILIHDYNHNWDGAKKAIDEFAGTIPEGIIELPDWQGSAVIVKNRK